MQLIMTLKLADSLRNFSHRFSFFLVFSFFFVCALSLTPKQTAENINIPILATCSRLY